MRRLRNRLPSCPIGDAANSADANVELARNISEKHTGGSQAPNFDHLSHGEFCLPRKFTTSARGQYFATRLTILGNLIRDVVLACSKKQMVWVNTQPNVAFVKNTKPARDFAVRDFPCEPMRPVISATVSKFSVAVDSSSRPQPATIKSRINALVGQWAILVDLAPKSVESFSSFVHSHIMNVVSSCRSLVRTATALFRL